jgi:hypothetical protein
MDLTSAIAGGFPFPRAREWRAREWRAREWRLGRRFGRRLTRLPPPRPSPVPLYSLGTAARIERLHSWYAADGRVTDADPVPVFQHWSA